jgi:PAS domain S-box-containing protein
MKDRKKTKKNLNRDTRSPALTEEAVRESEEKYRILTERSPIGIVIMEKEKRRVTFANPAACEMTGYSAEELNNVPLEKWSQMVHAEDRPAAAERAQRILANKRVPADFQYRLIRKDGSVRWVESNSAPITYRGKKATQIVMVDITERKRAERELQKHKERLEEMVADRTAELKESKEYLDSVIDAFDDPIFVKDDKHRWVLLNDAACRMLGRSRNELIGKSDYDFLPKEQADEFWRVDDLVFKTGEPNVNEEKITWGKEIRTISTKKSLLVDRGTGRKYIVGIIRDITDRVEAEAELRESKERLQIIFDYAPEAYYLTDTEGRFVDGNRAAEEMSGYGKDELIGKTVIESNLLNREEIPKALRLLERNRRGDPTGPVEFTILRKDGRQLILEISSYPVTIQGQLLILNIARDITEHKTLDQQIEESEKSFRLAFEQVAVGMTHIALDGHFIKVNEKFCDIVGYSRPELLKRRFQDITHPDDLQENLDLTRQLLNGEISQLTTEKRYIHKEGYPVWVHLTATLIRDHSGQPDYFICVLEDIGVRKWTEEELARSEDRLKILFEYAPDGYFTLDARGRMVDCNRAAEELTGYRRKELVGKSILKFGLALEEELPKWAAFLEELTRGRSLGPQEFTLVRKNSERLSIEFSAFPVEIEGQLQLLIIARDITERTKREREQLAKSGLLDSLRNATTIEECLRLGCRALRDGKLYQRAVMTLHNERHEITHLGQMGLDPKVVRRARQGTPPDSGLRKKMMADRFRISRSIFIPAEENLPFGKTRRYIPQKKKKNLGPELWVSGDELFVPILRGDGVVEGYLSVDTPWDEKRPDRQAILVLEDIVDIVARQIHEIRNRQMMEESEETTQALMNATTDSAILVDTGGYLLALNEAAAQRFGKSVEELIGIDGFSLLSPQLAKQRKKMMHKAIRTKKPVRFQDQRGDLFFDTTMYPVIDARGHVARVAVFGRHISEEIETKEALQESESKYRELTELLPTPVFEIDIQGRITTTNRAGLDLFGYQQDDIDKGLNVLSLLVPEEKSRVQDNISKRLRGESFEDHEYIARRKDGTVFPVIIFSSSILRNGQPVGLRGVVVDISDRKRMENALRQSEEKFRGLAENVPDVIFTTDVDGRITYISPALKDVLGYHPKEAVGKLYHAFLKSSEVPLAINHFTRVLKGEAVRALQLDMKRKDRSIVSTELSAAPIRTEGQITGTRGIIRDITEQVRARQEIERSAEKYRNIVELAPDAIITVDMKGTVTSCNRMFLKQYGLSEDDILNRPFWDSPVMTPGREQEYKKLFKKILRSAEDNPFELQWSDAEGNRHHIEIRFSFLREGRKKTGLQAILRDVTERKRMVDKLRLSETTYRNLVELAPDAIVTVNREGFITSANQAALDMVGYTSHQYIGKHFSKLALFFKEDLPKFGAIFEALMEGKEIGEQEFQFQRKNGSTGWGEARCTLLKEKDAVSEILVIIRDITGRKRNEKIQRSLDRISDAVHTSADLKQLYRTIHQELIGLFETKNISISLFDPTQHTLTVEYHRDEKDHFEGCLPAGKTLTAYLMKKNKPLLLTAKKIRELKRSGTVKPIGAAPKVWMGVPLRVEGKAIGALVVNDYRDEKAFDELDLRLLELVSDTVALSMQRKQIEISLMQSEKLFRTLAEQSPHMIYVNAFGPIVFANKKCEKVFGYKRKEYTSPDFDFLRLIADQSKDLIKKKYDLHRKGEEIPPYECYMVTRRGRKFKTLHTTKLITYHGQPAILGILTEIE